MRIPILISCLTTLSLTSVRGECSTVEALRVILEETVTQPSITQRIVNNVTRTKYEPTAEVTIIEAVWKSVYCPPVEFGVFKDCVHREASRIIDKDALKTYSVQSRVLVPDPCHDGECDGMDEKSCLEPSSFMTVIPPYHANLTLSSSWLHHRCSREIHVTLTKATAKITVPFTKPIYLEIPEIGSCELKAYKDLCSMADVLLVKLRKPLDPKTQIISLPCLTDKSDLICYDKEEQFQVSLSTLSCDHLPGLTYCKQDSNDIEQFLHSNSQATLEDWSEVSNQLIYETMETSFQASLIQSQVMKLKDLIASMILFQYGLTEDPLEKILGFKLGNPALINGSIVGFVCHPEAKRGTSKLTNYLHTEELHLLPKNSSIAQYKPFKARFAFLSHRVPRLFSSYGFSKLKHGNGHITDFSSILEYLPLNLIKSVVGKAITMLTICNTFMILFMLRRS